MFSEQLTFISQTIGRPYEFSAGPGVEGEPINCQKLVHSFMKENFNVLVPTSVRSQEIYHDDGIHFRNIDYVRQTRFGDVFLFSNQENSDPKKFHLACQVAISRELDQPLLIHANIIENKVSIWPLDHFATIPRYETLIGKRRIISKNI
jgi:hypothetical protein